jgi:hypothetical protein
MGVKRWTPRGVQSETPRTRGRNYSGRHTGADTGAKLRTGHKFVSRRFLGRVKSWFV